MPWRPPATRARRRCSVAGSTTCAGEIRGGRGRRSEYPRDIWAEEVMAVAEHAGIVGAPIVVGHSMGGFVTIAAAARYGDRLAGAVILDSPVRRPNPEEEEGGRGRA